MSYQYPESITMTKMECGGCGIVFAVPEHWYSAKVNCHGSFTCPNGCSRKFTAQTEAEQFKARLEKEQREAARLREQAVHAERAKDKAEKSLTRLKKRAAAGVCPCCNRTVAQLAAHMKAKHAQFRELQGLTERKQLAEKVQ